MEWILPIPSMFLQNTSHSPITRVCWGQTCSDVLSAGPEHMRKRGSDHEVDLWLQHSLWVNKPGEALDLQVTKVISVIRACAAQPPQLQASCSPDFEPV